jgi:hypothetical protein
LLARYEDLHQDTRGQFKRLLSFLEVEIQNDLIDEAISYGSFENMSRMQKEGTAPTSKDSGKKVIWIKDPENPEARHVRKGKIGGYRDYLTQQECDRFEGIISQELDPWFGYTEPPTR